LKAHLKAPGWLAPQRQVTAGEFMANLAHRQKAQAHAGHYRLHDGYVAVHFHHHLHGGVVLGKQMLHRDAGAVVQLRSIRSSHPNSVRGPGRNRIFI